MPLSVPLSELAGNSAGKKAENSFLSFQLFLWGKVIVRAAISREKQSIFISKLKGIASVRLVHLAMTESGRRNGHYPEPRT